MIPFNLSTRNGTQVTGQMDTVPATCPICHRAISPLEQQIFPRTQDEIEKTFVCPRAECGHVFLARYVRREGPPSNTFYLKECLPAIPKTQTYSDTISKISPDFVKIATQAEEAEQLGLDLICGPGYRKALEFLIKDYVMRLNSGHEKEIKVAPLASCIKTYVKNDKIQTVASRAVWLANDETHYVRKWDDKELKDLKELIKLTVLWIEMEETTAELLKDMPAGK